MNPRDDQRADDLRARAAAELKGAAAGKGAACRAVDALTVLHAMALSPRTAPDALTLLHELQVHQVELELQAQELQDARIETEAALRRQLELYNHQPTGCFTVTPRLDIQELNQRGADMLGLSQDDALGLSMHTFLGAENLDRLLRATPEHEVPGQAVAAQSTSLRMRLRPCNGPERQVVATISNDPALHGYLVNLIPDPGSPD